MATAKARQKELPGTPVSAPDKKRANQIYTRLQRLYPDATCALYHKNPFQLLMATILSAQCTDIRVNMVTPLLFKKFPSPKAMSRAKQSELETIIHSTGFYRNKAKSIIAASQTIHENHGGKVPRSMEELLKLKGVARKTANVVLGNAFDINVGVVVDTHIGRLSRRLGFSQQTDPKKVEKDLMALFDSKKWTMLAHLLIYHGRQVCSARKPLCNDCSLAKWCPKIDVPQV